MIHQLKTLCRLIPVLILLLAGTSHALAQKEAISLDARNITVRELLNVIEKKSSYTFAYADADLPLDRRVTIKAVNKPISSILREALPGTSVKVQNKKILLARASAPEQKKEQKKQPEAQAEEKKPGNGWNLTGTVVDEKGEPLIGATVMVKGTNLGASTDADGKFIIRVASAHPVVVARYVGYNPAEMTASKGKNLKIALKSSSTNLNEVVVTALGITREQKSLGYAVTKVEGEDLNNTVSGNWLNALDGKVAGLSATGAGSGPNGSMRIVLRGDQSLNYGSNEALFVVDGVPINSGDAGTGSGGTYSNADSPVDFGNAASEINPEDVESVSVLKGPAATALYGSRAANGAIVITTKSGKKTKGIGVTVNSSVTFERAGYFPDFQKEYGPGNDNGFGQYGFWQFKNTEAPEGFTPTTVTSRYAFGEKFDASKLRNQYESYNWETGEYTLLPYVYADDWYTGIFRTGTTFKNSVTLTSNNGKGTSSRVSVTDTRNNWIMPNTGYTNTSVSFSFNTKISKWIKIQAKGNYLHKTSDNTPISGYSTSAPTYYIIWGTNNISMDSYKNEYFAGRCTKENYESNRYDGKSMVNRLGNTEPGNPYQQLYEATNSINKDRFYGNVLVQVSFPVKGLSLDLRAGTDFMTDFRQQKKPFRTPGYKSGFYREQNNRDNETNLDFMLKYVNNELFGQRLGLNAAFGGNNMTRSVWRHSITLSKLGEEGVYNSTNLPTGENPREYNWRSRKVVNSFYGFLNASWDNTYFLDVTARNDWSSALGRHNWSFFYPSVSASVLLDHVLKMQDKAPWVNMLKVRGSWANVGNDTSPYTLVDSYTSSSTYPGSYELPGNRANYYIKPENVESWEVGIETKLFMNRLGFDIAYYNSRTTNQIISAVTDPIIGSSSKKMNCGEIRNQGIEIALHGVPVRTRDFTWSIDINWARNWNKLVSLEDGWDPEIPYQQAQNELYASKPKFEKGTMDLMYAGDMAKWRKFNNSIYLRLLCRVSGRPEMKSGEKMQEMLDNPSKYPVFESNGDNATVRNTGVDPYYNHFRPIDIDQSKFSSSSYLIAEQFLKMTLNYEGSKVEQDPRLTTWAIKRSGVDDWKGTIAGCQPEDGGVAGKDASFLNYNVLVRDDAHAFLMDYSEVQFILAEAALKGMISGGETAARNYYENAVAASCYKWAEYEQYSKVKAPIDEQNVTKFLNGNLAGWDNNPNKEKLICEQKFLSLFWVGMEAYHELRRTGWPVLTMGEGTYFNNYQLPQRFAYCITTTGTNPQHVAEALQRMGGENDMLTPVWWSLKAITGNFPVANPRLQ